MRLGRLVFLVLLAPGFCGFAQQSKTDSLESLIRSVPADTTKVWLLNELVSSLRERDSRKALAYANEAKQLADLLVYRNGQAQALEHMGWIHYRKGDFSESFDLSGQGLRIYEQTNNRAGIARSLINISAINYEQKYYKQSIDNLKKAYAISRDIGDKATMTRSLSNIGFDFMAMKMLDSASVYCKRAMEIGKTSGNIYLIGFTQRTLGDIYFEKGELADALNEYHQVYRFAEKIENTFLKVSTIHRLAKTFNKMDYPDKALDYLYINIKLAKQNDYKDELERTYKLMADIYKAKGNFKNALAYQSAYLAIHDSLYSQRSAEHLALLNARFDSEIQKAQIDLLTKDGLLKEEEINSQRVWMIFYIGSLTLVIILVFVLFFYNQLGRKAKRELELKNEEIQKQTEQLTNLNATKDKLFSIISHDLRSPVASLKGLMELVSSDQMSQEEFNSVAHGLKKNLDFVFDDLNNLLQWAQSQLKGIQTFPEVVNMHTSVEEVVSLFSETAERKRIEIQNDVDDDVFVFADRNQLKIIIRNLLTNAIKFNAPGGRVRIHADMKDDMIEISVADSGVGMDAGEMNKLFNAETHFTKPGTNKEKGVGIGLLLTSEFVVNNGGTIRVTSTVGKGSTFTFRLRAGLVSVKKEGALSSSL